MQSILYKKISVAVVSLIAFCALIGSNRVMHGSAQAQITVQGKHCVSIVADNAKINLAVVTKDAMQQGALDKNSQIVERVYAALDALQAKRGGDGFSVYPEYDYKNGKNTQSGYVARHSMSITTQADNAGSVIDAAIKAGANEIGSVIFSNSHSEQHYRQALALALEDARLKAQALASGASIELVSVQEECGFSPVLYRAAAMETAIEAGELELNVVVRAVYAIKD